MGFNNEHLGIAASVFLGIYVLYTINSIFIISKSGWKTVYTPLCIYGIIKIGGQISGIGFAINGLSPIDWFICYLILGAEGFMVLIILSRIFLITEQRRAYGESPLVKLKINPLCHLVLVPANALVIISGCILAGNNLTQSDLDLSKRLRIAGQALFLSQVVLISVLTWHSFFIKKLKTPTMKCLVIVAPFLMIRSIYGMLSIFINDMNYFNFNSYNNGGSSKVTIYEYVLGFATELIAASLFMNTFWIRRRAMKHVTNLDIPDDTSDTEKV